MEKKDTKNEEKLREERELVSQETQELRANGKKKKNESTRKINRLWLWLGVIVLIFILLWWLWMIGTFEDITGVTNG